MLLDFEFLFTTPLFCDTTKEELSLHFSLALPGVQLSQAFVSITPEKQLLSRLQWLPRHQIQSSILYPHLAWPVSSIWHCCKFSIPSCRSGDVQALGALPLMTACLAASALMMNIWELCCFQTYLLCLLLHHSLRTLCVICWLFFVF